MEKYSQKLDDEQFCHENFRQKLHAELDVSE